MQPRTKEHSKKISESLKANRRKLSAEEIKKLTDARRKVLTGKPPWNKGLKGFMSGSQNWSWKGGITPLNAKIRNSAEYKLWREAVFKRDNYTCVFCRKRGGEKHADHIKPFALFPELRFAIDNGRTLCVPCHRNTDTYGGRYDKLRNNQ